MSVSEADVRSDALFTRLLEAQRIQDVDAKIAALFELYQELESGDISIRADIQTSLGRIAISQCSVSEESTKLKAQMQDATL